MIPNADSRGAYVTAERLRHRVRDAVEARHPGLTMSFGIASYPKDGESAERLLRCADKSLYAAKTLGRDRTVIYSREVVGALASGPAGDDRRALEPDHAADARGGARPTRPAHRPPLRDRRPLRRGHGARARVLG